MFGRRVSFAGLPVTTNPVTKPGHDAFSTMSLSFASPLPPL
jgi:hypothetical protein